MQCARLEETMQHKRDYLSKWGNDQLIKDAAMAKSRRRPSMSIRVRNVNSETPR